MSPSQRTTISESESESSQGSGQGSANLTAEEISNEFEAKLEKIVERAEKNASAREIRAFELMGVLAALLAFGSAAVSNADQLVERSLLEALLYLFALFFPFGFFAMLLHQVLYRAFPWNVAAKLLVYFIIYIVIVIAALLCNEYFS